MRVVLDLTIREWLTLDWGLAFFRQMPLPQSHAKQAAGGLKALHCRLRRAGIVGCFRPMAAGPRQGQIDWHLAMQQPMAWDARWSCLLGRRLTRTLIHIALTIIGTQAHRGTQPLQRHEVELLQTLQRMLTQMRRQKLKVQRLSGYPRSWPLVWHRPTQQYLLPETLSKRIHHQACHERASLN